MNLKPIKHSHLFKTAIDKKVNYNLGSAMYKEPWIDHVKDTTVVGRLSHIHGRGRRDIHIYDSPIR